MPELRRAWRRLLRGSERPRIVVRPRMGLANRLRAVTSCRALARHLGLGFALRWGPGEGFSDERWEDLFANDYPCLDEASYERFRAGGALDLGRWLGLREGRSPSADFDPRLALDHIRQRGLVWRYGFHNVDKMLARRDVVGIEPLQRLRRACCRELRPAAPIARRVEAFAAQHFGDGCVLGVHIRRGDALAGPRAASHLRSSDESFSREMQDRLDADPDLRFFLATDCEKTQAGFQQRFGDRLLCAEKPFVASVFGAPKQGQADALVDLLLLSRCGEVLGTYASTFGRMAAHVGGVRFLTAGT